MHKKLILKFSQCGEQVRNIFSNIIWKIFVKANVIPQQTLFSFSVIVRHVGIKTLSISHGDSFKELDVNLSAASRLCIYANQYL